MIELYNEDCLEGMKRIPDRSVDMILADLPYGVTSAKWDCVLPLDKLWDQYKRIIKDRGAIALFGIEPFSSYLRMSNIKWYKYDWLWKKETATGFLCAKIKPLSNIEDICIFGNGKINYYPIFQKGKPYRVTSSNHKTAKLFKMTKVCEPVINDGTMYYPKSILEFNKIRGKGKLHPTQKPVALLEYLIKTYTLEGETILDNTMGSGSTGVAAVNLNRNFIGYELNKEYFDIAKIRISEVNNE